MAEEVERIVIWRRPWQHGDGETLAVDNDVDGSIWRSEGWTPCEAVLVPEDGRVVVLSEEEVARVFSDDWSYAGITNMLADKLRAALKKDQAK